MSVALLSLAGCGSDADTTTSVAPASVTDATGQSVPSASVPTAPASANEIADAMDIRSVMAQLGLRADWPLPADLPRSDIVGLKVSQSAGSDSTAFDVSVAFRQPVADPASIADDWYDRAAQVFDIGPASGSGKVTGNGFTGTTRSGGLEDEPAGNLGVMVIQRDGDIASPVVVEIELERSVAGTTATDLQFPRAVIDALPDMTGCVPTLASAELDAYDSPNDVESPPSYDITIDARCVDRAAFDAAAGWSAVHGGRVAQTEDTVEITDAPGPGNSTLHVYSYLADDGTSTIRVDLSDPLD